jgi:hypothetical protein
LRSDAILKACLEGRSLLAQEAVKANLADRIATLDDVLAKYGVKGGSVSQYSSQHAEIPQGKGGVVVVASEPANPGSTPDNNNNDDNENAGPCGCACDACQSCTGSVPKPEGDDDLDMAECRCAGPCEACKACGGKGAAQASEAAKIAAQQKYMQTEAGNYLEALKRRRRQMALQ